MVLPFTGLHVYMNVLSCMGRGDGDNFVLRVDLLVVLPHKIPFGRFNVGRHLIFCVYIDMTHLTTSLYMLRHTTNSLVFLSRGISVSKHCSGYY